MTKIIFLDIDGVLNSEDFHNSPRGIALSKYVNLNADLKAERGEELSNRDIYIDHIDTVALSRLQEIIDETNAKIVLSSTWRFGATYDALLTILKEYNFTCEIIGKTGRGCEDCVRGNEIHAWIQKFEDVTKVPYRKYKNYVILDDDSDMLWWQRNNFIKTSSTHGLLDKHVLKAIKILNQE